MYVPYMGHIDRLMPHMGHIDKSISNATRPAASYVQLIPHMGHTDRLMPHMGHIDKSITSQIWHTEICGIKQELWGAICPVSGINGSYIWN